MKKTTGQRLPPVCSTPTCGRPIPKGGEGHPEICPTCLACLKFHEHVVAPQTLPLPMRIHCPKCGELHIDEGEFATKSHATHSCQHCGLTFRPAVVPTVGVRFLPGYKNEEPPIDWTGVLPHQLEVTCVDCGAGSTSAPGAFGWTFKNGEWRCEVHTALPLSGTSGDRP